MPVTAIIRSLTGQFRSRQIQFTNPVIRRVKPQPMCRTAKRFGQNQLRASINERGVQRGNIFWPLNIP